MIYDVTQKAALEGEDHLKHYEALKHYGNRHCMTLAERAL